MASADRDLGWEDVGTNANVIGSSSGVFEGGATGSMRGSGGGGGGGSMGEGAEVPGISDAVTSAMVNHFAREISKGSLSLWPGFIATARRYFNVTHGYVLRKAMWQFVPLSSTKKKSAEGELGGEKDWTVRVFDGLEADIEEPDLYIPTMGFVTYILLCGLIKGLQEQFHPDVLSASITFTLVLLIVETTVMKAVLFTSGAVNTPTVDLVALLGYKYFYLSFQLIFGLLLGRGQRPSGILYTMIALLINVACGVALWQALRRLARMQPLQGQECVSEMHKLATKALPIGQAAMCWLLQPSWPKAAVEVAASAALAAAAAAPEIAVAAAAAVATGNISGGEDVAGGLH